MKQIAKRSEARVRTRDNLRAPGRFGTWASSPGTSWSDANLYLSPLGEQELMTDVVQANFKARISQGEVIFNPMQQTRIVTTSMSVSPITRVIQAGATFGKRYGYNGDYLLMKIGGSHTTAPGGITHGLIPKRLTTLPSDRAIAEASTKAIRPPSEASLLVTLAEMDKTRRLVPDLLHSWSSLFQRLNRDVRLSRYVTALQSAKRLSISNLKNLERSAVETWLAMRFGVRPLVMDTLGVLKAVNTAYDDANDVRLTSRGKSFVAESDVQNVKWFDGPSYYDEVTISRHHSLQVRAMSLWEVRMDLLRNAGVSPAAVPEALIDLVRFSFVLNWVINVNDFFAALGAMADPDLHNLGGCYVLTEEIQSVWQCTSSVYPSSVYVVERPCSGVVQSVLVEKRRVPAQLSKLMKLVVRADPKKFTRDFRLLDAVALFRQQLRGRNVRALAKLS